MSIRKRVLSYVISLSLVINGIAYTGINNITAAFNMTIAGAEASDEKAVETTEESSQYPSSRNYDNLGFEDVKKFYYNQLSDYEKFIYNRFKTVTRDNPVATFTFTELGNMEYDDAASSFRHAYTALVSDEPITRVKFERYVDSVEQTSDGYKVYMQVNPYAHEYNLKKIDATLKQIVNTVQSSDRYTTLLKLWKYSADNYKYDEYYPFQGKKESIYDDSALGILVSDKTICAGFADAVKIICNELEIPCIVVGNAGHAWNFIEMEDGKWYSVDFSINVDWIEHLLLGYESGNYVNQSAYFIPCYFNDDLTLVDLYLGTVNDFNFPNLSKSEYTYQGENDDFSYKKAGLEFEEIDPVYVYEVNDDNKTCTITDFYGKEDGDLVIPGVLDGYTVTEIGESAFSRCSGFNGKLIIPDTVIKIDRNAFFDCTNLNALSIPDSVTYIGYAAFLGDKNIKGEIALPENLKYLGQYSFYTCIGLTGDIVIPDNIDYVGGAFKLCSGLDGTIFFPDNVEWNPELVAETSIKSISVKQTNERYAVIDGILYTKDMSKVLYCPPFKEGEISFPETLTEVGDYAFQNCENLRGNIVFPSGVKKIGQFAFDESGFDGKVVFNEGLEYIGDGAFQFTKITGDLIIPDTVTVVGSSAFSYCIELSGKLKLSKNLERIEDYTFYCNSYDKITEEIVIPQNVKYVGSYAFYFVRATNIYLNDVSILNNSSFEIDKTTMQLSSGEVVEFQSKFNCKCTNQSSIDWCIQNEALFTIEHNYIITSVPPTETEDGYTIYNCSACGDAYTEVHHNYSEWKTTEKATCTESGTKVHICTVCGEEETIEIPATGHTEVVDEAVEATCIKTGLTEGKHCSVCNTVIRAQEVVPATGKHSFGDWKITKAATCTAEGTQTRTCSGCGKVETQTIAKTAHKYVNTVVRSTYTAQGYTLHKCSVCGTSYKDTYTAKLTLAKVTGVKLGGRAADALRVNWNKDANASGYIVEMYQGNKWVRVAKITSNATTTYRASGLKASTVYKFRVRAYKMEGKAVAYGAYSTELAARTNPSVMTGAKLGGRAADALRINWTKNASADGYIVEMYQGNKWVRVAKITSNSTTTFRKAGLKASSVYKFRVRAYKMSGKTALYGNYSATVTARTNPSIVKGVKIGGKAKDALRVNWTKNASAQGYIVEMYKGGKWVRVAKITNGNTTTFRKAGLAKNTTYKFRVRAYHMSGKTALYGNYGSVSGKTAAK